MAPGYIVYFRHEFRIDDATLVQLSSGDSAITLLQYGIAGGRVEVRAEHFEPGTLEKRDVSKSGEVVGYSHGMVDDFVDIDNYYPVALVAVLFPGIILYFQVDIIANGFVGVVVDDFDIGVLAHYLNTAIATKVVEDEYLVNKRVVVEEVVEEEFLIPADGEEVDSGFVVKFHYS